MRPNHIFYILLTLCIIIFAITTNFHAAWGGVERTDYTVYTAAGQAILNHTDIYLAQNSRGWRYVYPPPFAILMVPLTHVSVAVGAFIWYVITVLAVGASSVMSASLLNMPALKQKHYLIYGVPLLSLCVLLASGAMRCQASPFMFCLMIASFYFHFNNKPMAAGFSLAAAAVIKVFPLTLALYFLLRRQWRELFATTAGLLVLGLLLPSLYWGWHFNVDQIVHWVGVVAHPAVMSNVDRVHATDLYVQLLDTSKPRNQSLESLFLSVGLPAALTHAAVGLTALSMVVVMWLSAQHIQQRLMVRLPNGLPSLQEGMLCSAVVIWSLLITPIAETHYFGVLILPLTLMIGYVVSTVPDEKTQLRYIWGGCAIMIVVMILIGIHSMALWRPLCLVSIVMWLICIRTIWLPATAPATQVSSGVGSLPVSVN